MKTPSPYRMKKFDKFDSIPRAHPRYDKMTSAKVDNGVLVGATYFLRTPSTIFSQNVSCQYACSVD